MGRDIKDVLKEIEDNKKIAEGRIIGSLLNQMDLITDYPINPIKLTEMGRFYYNLISNLYSKGYKDIDKVTIANYLKDLPSLEKQYQEYGSYNTLKTLSNASSVVNIDAVIKEFEKYVMLEELSKRHFRIEEVYDSHLKRMPDAKTIESWYEVNLDDASVNINYSDIEFESFEITDDDMEAFKQGAMIGVRYNSTCPLLDYSTLGFPIENFTIIGSYVNMGKTSFMAHTMFGMAGQGQKVGIIANEQSIRDYKMLLIMFVLVYDLRYIKMNRKTFKLTTWTKEDMEQIQKARKIIKEKYAPNLSFFESYDYDTSVVSRVIRRWSKMGFDLAIYDTLKADFTTADGWISLIKATRNLYQLAHKESIAVVGVMQLRLSDKKRRILDLDVLANGKQSSETASEVIFFRELFEDEMPGEKNEASVYKYEKDKNGQFVTSSQKIVQIDPSSSHKDYRVFTICKTRNDRVGTSILYKFNGDFNVWQEIGYIDVKDDYVVSQG